MRQVIIMMEARGEAIMTQLVARKEMTRREMRTVKPVRMMRVRRRMTTHLMEKKRTATMKTKTRTRRRTHRRTMMRQ